MEEVLEGEPTVETSESRKTPRRPDDEEDKAVPAKIMKISDELSAEDSNDVAQETNDSEIDLGDEEEYDEIDPQQNQGEAEEDEEQLDLEADYAGESDQPGPEYDEDFEEGDTYDEDEEELGTTAEEMDDTVQEEPDSSTDLQDFVQHNLGYIEDCQSDIDNLNHKANEEILLVELKYNKLRLPVYKRRNTYIERVPHFWATVFSQHRHIRQVLTKEDIKCLKHVTKLQVEDFEENRAGYSIQFYFSENPWFENKTITKEYHLPWHGSPSCACSPIKWKKGMNLTTSQASSFFKWFTSQNDASADDIAEIIKDDLWPNPLQCFLLNNKQPDESEEDDEADDSGNLNPKDDSIVLLDDAPDDDVEYISSEEEEEDWQGGKGRPADAQYTVADDEGDEPDDDEYEEFDDEDPDVTGSSEPPVIQINDERKDKDEVINIDDDYLGSEEEDEAEYFDGTVDLEGDEKLLQGQVENEGIEDSKGTEESHDKSGEEPRLPEEVEVQYPDSSHGTNDDSRQSNGIVGSSTNVDDGSGDKIDLQSTINVKSKMQEQSKVVSTSSDADAIDGAT